MKKKAIIFDVDGTIMPVGEGNWPSERMKKAIQSLQDRYYISTATGRSSQYVKDIIDYLGLTDDCIIAAGTEIYNPISKKVVWSEKIPVTLYPHISQVLQTSNEKVFSAQNRMEGITGKDIGKLLDGNVAALYVVAVEEATAEKLYKSLLHRNLTIINMHSFWGAHLRDIHILSSKASKEHAVTELLKRLDVTKEDSIVIGDGLNDLHLFAAGGTKIAMGNAVAELKTHADIIIGDVLVDGLAEYLESM